MTAVISIRVNSDLYLRDPEGTELGKRIISSAIQLIDSIGFEALTFKKLAEEIKSTEASIYRYFSNKHQLLNYLVAWYWSWVCYLIQIKTTNIEDPIRKFRIVIEVLVESSKSDPTFSHVDEATLHRIVMAESARVHMARQAKSLKQSALFEGLEALRDEILPIIKAINPRYKYPHALIDTLIATTKRQIFYVDNFPRMTELTTKRGSYSEVMSFVEKTFLKVLQSGSE